jgi:uncharacterized protein
MSARAHAIAVLAIMVMTVDGAAAQSQLFEYQAFADADQLDALGAIGIARAFAFGGAHHRPIWNPDPDPVTPGLYGASSIHHFYEKLLRLHGDMYTDAARQLAAHRVAVMEEFLRTFYAEWGWQGRRDSQSSRTVGLIERPLWRDR